MKAKILHSIILPSIRRITGHTAILFFLIFSPEITVSQYWSALPGGGMNDWVYATTIYNGDLIVGGKFTMAGGVSANHIARWDGTSWTPLGIGVNGKVNALTVYKGNLVAAGEFTLAGGIETNFIAQWDGTAWDDELGGVGSTVTSLAVIGNDLYVGGYFTEADNTPVNYIAKRNSSGWHALGSGMNGTEGQVMALTVHNGELYAGGFFTSAGGVSANHIARWNGTSWSALGLGISNIVYSLAGYNGNLIAGGLFLSAGGVPANNIASWNGTTWSAMGGGMTGLFYQYVFALTVYNGNLIAGGYFTLSEGVPVNGIAKWDGSGWSAMGGGFFYPANVYGAHTLCVYGTDLIAGGLFSSAGSANASHIASWNEPVLPAVLTIQNDTIPNGTYNCYNATQTISVAGNGTSFVIQDGGNTTMVSGQNILLLPGVKVDSGGYLFGYITTNGQFCGTAARPVTASVNVDDTRPYTRENIQAKVYPNPSAGDFFVESYGMEKSGKIQVQVYNMLGYKISTCTLTGGQKHLFSISDQPAGVYFVRLSSDGYMETVKIIRQE